MERSNTYIFVYSIVLVVVVAAVLSFTAFSLKDLQNANVANEKRQNILSSIDIQVEASEAKEAYKKYIKESFLVKPTGETSEYLLVKNGQGFDTITAFDIDMTKLYAQEASERNLPIFKAEKEGVTYLIIPLMGKGLWGPIWGYISLLGDINTVNGAVFDHQGETAGLGAEINKDKFELQFSGKKIFDEEGAFKSIRAIKGGASDGDVHGVDAISGGTITCNGVNDMIYTCLNGYVKYFESIK